MSYSYQWKQWKQWEQWQQWEELDQQARTNSYRWEHWKQFEECQEQVEETDECQEQVEETEDCVEQIEEIEDCEERVEEIAQTHRNVRRQRRIISDRTNPFTAMSDTEFIDRFRLRKESVNSIIQEIKDHLPVVNDRRGCPVPPHLQVLITMAYMASESLQSTIANSYNVSQTHVCRSVAKVARAIALQRHHYIKFPSGNDLYSVMLGFNEIAGMPEVIGCINCTHVKILKPSRADSESFKCKKGFYSLNVQAICGPDLQFYNIVARWPGSVHDSKIFLKSRIHDQLQDGLLPGHLLGDSEYPCRTYLLTPLASPNGPQEKAYNNSHISTMNTIKKAFRVLKHRFGRLGTTIRTNIETTQAIVVATAVLHNIAVKTGLELVEENLEINMNRSDIENNHHNSGNLRLVNDHDNVIDDNNEEALQGHLKRAQLIRDHFNTAEI